jgi:transposase-like protein
VQVNIKNLIDDAQCYQTIRELRWPDGITCPSCASHQIIKRGFDDTEPGRQRYECHDCDKRFDALTDTIFAGHHQPLKVWVLCLYFMGLNLSNEQIGQELALNGSDVQQMTAQLREGIEKKPTVTLFHEGECDEAYVIAGHKGQPEVVKSKGRQGRRRRLQGKSGRGTIEKESPPGCGMMQRGGQVVINLLANVKQKTIEPLIKDPIVPGTLVYTDEYSIYARLQSWGYGHKSVHHGRGEFARDDDGDGCCEVHVHTMEGFVRSVG